MYINYMQQGGQATSIEEQVAALVQAAMSGDQQAQLQVEQIMQAAQQGDQQAQQIAQMIQAVAQQLQGGQEQQPQMAKCGTTLNKLSCGSKIKKAKCGTKANKVKKAEIGLPINKKGGCPCKLKKLGGKLVEIDCNGNIIK